MNHLEIKHRPASLDNPHHEASRAPQICTSIESHLKGHTVIVVAPSPGPIPFSRPRPLSDTQTINRNYWRSRIIGANPSNHLALVEKAGGRPPCWELQLGKRYDHSRHSIVVSPSPAAATTTSVVPSAALVCARDNTPTTMTTHFLMFTAEANVSYDIEPVLRCCRMIPSGPRDILKKGRWRELVILVIK